MNSLLLFVALLGGASAHTQLLPAPGAPNPDWTFEKSIVQPDVSRSTPLAGTHRMPNAAQKSISSIGNRHYHWDANRQLAYEWLSRPNTGSVASDQTVTVREESTGTMYTYRRRAPLLVRPHGLPGHPHPSK